jgi:hypothetical protein
MGQHSMYVYNKSSRKYIWDIDGVDCCNVTGDGKIISF